VKGAERVEERKGAGGVARAVRGNGGKELWLFGFAADRC
jgi:hypothetical protein